MATATASSYPVTFDIEYPGELSRWKIFVKWLLAIPHLIVVYGLTLALEAITFVAWFAILFTGRYPRGLFDFAVGVLRWQFTVNSYVLLMRDEYPPFSLSATDYPVQVDIQYPEKLSRLLIFVKWLLVIPNFIVLYFLLLAYFVTLVIAWFAILFTGRYPRGLFDFAVGVWRWYLRVYTYMFLLRDEYPPFSTK